MRTAIHSLLILLTLSGGMAAQSQSCSDYSSLAVMTEPTVVGTAYHSTGNHQLNALTANATCTYTSVGEQYCHVVAVVNPTGLAVDTGNLTTAGYWHDMGAAPQTATDGPDTTATATGIEAGVAVQCSNLTICDTTIITNPTIVYPSGAIWIAGASFPLSCAAKVDPTYNNGGGGCKDGVTCHCCTCVKGGGCDSPIIVDVRGTGFRLSSAQAGVVFDIRGDGKPERVAWPLAGSGNAFLALDRNGNGIIDGGKELFGNYTAQPKCANPNGFLALDVFDDNHDGVIDEHDAIFTKLRLWIDENRDGISQPEELHPLKELGVYSLSLRYTESPQTDIYGNEFKLKARVNPEGEPNGDRIDRWTYDVWLVTETDVKHGRVKTGTDRLILARE